MRVHHFGFAAMLSIIGFIGCAGDASPTPGPGASNAAQENAATSPTIAPGVGGRNNAPVQPEPSPPKAQFVADRVLQVLAER